MNRLQLNSNSKYNITLKAPPELVCTKNTALGACLEKNTALGFASCCIYLSTRLLVLYFSYSTRGGALSNMYGMYGVCICMVCIAMYMCVP